MSFVIINGDSDIDYYTVYGTFETKIDAEEALVGFQDNEEDGENMVRVVELKSTEALQEVIRQAGYSAVNWARE